MTRVDFYILSGDKGGDRLGFACRLTEKVYQQGRRVVLYVASAAEARHLDRLLWTFRQGSFIPHGIAGSIDPGLTPVSIGYGEQPAEGNDVLINLNPSVPSFFSGFDRVAEVIDDKPDHRASGRQRFRFYRDHGYPLTSHDIPA